ncbi:MAG: LPS export ABC transporter periplasmic protein LptC [Kiritimatiellae bacterium]|nr:LPS export ABC transporter periplasmic protein LptC [Kiritimatiellia bacterium]
MQSRVVWIGVWSVVVLLCAGTGYTQNEITTLTDFSVPEYDAEGNLASELMGDYADILPNGNVRVRNLRIDSYKDNEVDMSITSPECEYYENEKTASSDADVRIARDNMVVTGSGFSWNAAENRLVIKSNVKVVLKNARNQVNTGDES